MAKSERARELAEKQKAEAKALRAAKRNSDNPRDWGTLKQIRESYRLTKQVDPQLPWLLLGAWLLVSLAGLGIALAIGASWWMGLLTGIALGMSAALLILTMRTKKGTYTRYKGQPGAGEVPLSMLNKKKWTVQPAITVTRQQDCIHRVVGPAGVVLLGDGDGGRLKQTLANDAKRHQQVLYGIDVHAIQMGDGEGQVPMEKVAKYIKSLPKTLDSVQAEEVQSRLKALDAMKSRIPIPKGPLPTSTKGARKAMRGR